jgi:hypothetical protein
MAGEVTVKVNYDKLLKKFKELERPIDRETSMEVGRAIVAEMKDKIAAGKSPIKGREFPPYKKPDKYPGNKKAHSPVNLYLTGQMLSRLRYQVEESKYGWSVFIGYTNDRAAAKEQGHREGKNKQPRRPTIPSKNERFDTTIRQIYEKLYRERIAKLVKG